MTSTPNSQASSIHSTPSYFSYPVSHVVSGLYRRLTEPSPSKPTTIPTSRPPSLNMHNGMYTPPHRTASPFQPPPLTPLSLTGIPAGSSESAQILSRGLAEEIRLLVPPRLQLAETWSLVYSLENDGVSLATLYKKCAAPSVPKRGSFVLVVKDAAGGVSTILPWRQHLRLNGTLTVETDLWCIPDRPTPPVSFFLRHRRMFPLARHCTANLCSPVISPTSAVCADRRYARPKYYHRISHEYLTPPITFRCDEWPWSNA